VPEGTVQRSDTPLGIATPVDTDEVLPHPKQEDVERAGAALRHGDGAGDADPAGASGAPGGRQKGELLQRSDTPHGVTTPIPAGDAVDAKLERTPARRRRSAASR
jgi:hypothetical protein